MTDPQDLTPRRTDGTDQRPAAPEPHDPPTPDRERLRDLLIVIVTYPLTPTARTTQVAARKPWLETLSLLLKVALAAYALYEGVQNA